VLLNQLCLSFVAMMLLILGGVFLSYGWGPPGLEKIVWTLVVVISLIMFKEYVRQTCFAYMEMVNAFLVDLSVSVLQIGALLVLVYWGNLSVPLTFGAVGLAGIIPALGWLLIRAQPDTFRFAFTRVIPDFRRCWLLGKWLFLTTVASQFGPEIYPWLLAFFYGTGDTGVLAACMGIIMLANPFVLGMANYFHPLCSHAFAQGGVEPLRRQVNRGMLLFLVVLGTFCVAMLMWGDQLVTLVYGNKYSDTRLLLSLLALSQLASTLTFPINSGLLALKLPEVGFKSSLLAIGITVTAGVGLVKTLGPVGVGIGLLLGNAASSAFRWIAFKRKIDGLSRSARNNP
jgi:O-antigen/teichoic acid export membrane protein